MLDEQQYDLAAEVLRFPVPPTASENLINGTAAAEELGARRVCSCATFYLRARWTIQYV